MVHHTLFRFTELPGVMRMGMLILAVGGALDVFYHTAPLGWAIWLDGYLGRHGAGAHLVTLLGMVVMLLGLLVRRASVQMAHVADTASERRSSIEQ